MNRAKKRILIVSKDESLRQSLVTMLEDTGNYLTTEVDSFEDALNEILLSNYEMILTEADLSDLSGIDLLAVVNSIRPHARVILFDDDLSAKSAVAAFRLGAVDYLRKPLNMAFVLLQIERHLQIAEARERIKQSLEQVKQPLEARDRSKRLNPQTRAAALMLNRRQFEQINLELESLLFSVRANFVGLIDTDGNMIGAAGELDEYDLQALSQALTVDYSSQKNLNSLLGSNHFTTTYFRGEHYEVYIIEFGVEQMVSLALVCEPHVKQGVIWLYAKRTASLIAGILKASKTRQTRNFQKLVDEF